MVREIVDMVHQTRHETGCETLSGRVVAALRRVERHRFVPTAEIAQAYDNRPLPIGAGQTISQPFIVALMTELMALDASSRVLEVGTGSGYQAAVLAELVAAVYSIEVIEPLGLEAARALAAAGYQNVHTRVGDGYAGWPQEAPFDAIIVTAAAPELPQPLIDQLKPGGRLVLPLEAPDDAQSLTVVEKDATGAITSRSVLRVRFVPFARH
ncbi:MAG: protein-L-isoaspartate(D-aspartate) O-methyltransferase [Burkholderiaceae bacterium]|nr:protein-L-isoaspartate(D-aspartate) O-methyltransferase [Burkholderiaceae bacterium]